MDRVLIVGSGTEWYVRRVRLVTHDLDLNEKVYRCDLPLGDKFASPSEAAAWVERHAIPEPIPTVCGDKRIITVGGLTTDRDLDIECTQAGAHEGHHSDGVYEWDYRCAWMRSITGVTRQSFVP